MKKFITYGKIRKFADIKREVIHKARFTGLDNEGKPTYDNTLPLPVITATGSEKIHGTNAAFCWDGKEFWVQSRNNIIDLKKDNAGCAEFCHQRQEEWLNIAKELVDFYDIDLKNKCICIYFEFAGGNIQAHSALTGLQKQAIIFQHFKVYDFTKENGLESTWLETACHGLYVSNNKAGIYNIMQGERWEVCVDFNKTATSEEEIEKIIFNEVEPNSPFGRFLKKDGNVGEGCVFTFFYKGDFFRFKAKGEKHSKSKVNKFKKSISVEDEALLNKCVDSFLTKSRLNQVLEQVYGHEHSDLDYDVSKTGDVIRWLINDIIDEEREIILRLELDVKALKSKISQQARVWYMNLLK